MHGARLHKTSQRDAMAPVFELPGGGVGGRFNPNCFLNPPNILSNYALGVGYVLYT